MPKPRKGKPTRDELIRVLKKVVFCAGWGTDDNWYAEIDPDTMDEAQALLDRETGRNPR